MVDPFYRCINARRLKLVGAEKTAWLVQGIDLSVRRYWLRALERALLRTGYMPKSWPRKGARIIKYRSIFSFFICASFETGRS